MPRKAKDSEETEESHGNGNGAGGNGGDDNLVVGEPKDIEQQVKEARGEEEDGKKAQDRYKYTDGSDKEVASILDEADPERKARQVKVEALTKFHEKFPETDPNKADNRNFKVELADEMKGEKLYIGRLTLQSIHGETHEKISYVCEIGGYGRGEDYLFYVMKNAHPHAMREHFTIDAENKTDPLLRTRFE